MNRDTLYSFVIADISEGASVTVPDAGDRYLSVVVVNQDHYINRLYHVPRSGVIPELRLTAWISGPSPTATTS
jgi:hypothetical protein